MNIYIHIYSYTNEGKKKNSDNNNNNSDDMQTN